MAEIIGIVLAFLPFLIFVWLNERSYLRRARELDAIRRARRGGRSDG